MIWIQRNNNPTINSVEPSSSSSSSHVPNTDAITTTTATATTSNSMDIEDDDDNDHDDRTNTMALGQQELAEAEEIRRLVHSETAYTMTDRQNLARIRNAIYLLRCTLSYITPEGVTTIYRRSCSYPPTRHNIANMLLPEHIVHLTQSQQMQ